MAPDTVAELDLDAARAAIGAAGTVDELDAVRKDLTGKGSAAARVKQSIKDLPGDQKPVVGGDSCQTPHLGVIVSGRIHIAHDDGTEADIGPGVAYTIEPGHDAWVVGDEQVVAYEFDTTTAATYATPS